MKKKFKSRMSKIMIIFLTFMLVSFNLLKVNSYAEDKILINEVNEAIEKTHNHIVNNGTWSSDWKTVAFNKSGLKLPQNYNEDYLKERGKLLQESKGYFYKVTDYERIMLGVVAAGGDPRNVGGYNLLEKIYNYSDPNKPKNKIDFQGLNGVIYALIALDSNNFELPKDAKYSREYMLDYVLNNRNKDGGWDLNMNGKTSDVDITSMTLIALAPYHEYVNKDGKAVKTAIDEAINWLSNVQRKDGGFNSWFTENNSESCAQTVIGLCANGVDPTSEKFTKDRNLIENLLRFQQANGEFYHLLDGSQGVNGMSTEQAFQALISYRDYVSKKGSIYWFHTKKVFQIYNKPLSNGEVKGNNENNFENMFNVIGEEKVQRISGNSKVNSSIEIAKKIDYYRGKGNEIKNVVIASSYSLADALSGGSFAKKLDAPILLSGKNLEENNDLIEYISSNLKKDGNIYILGGNSVDSGTTEKLQTLGYKNINKIYGQDRIETCTKVVNEIKAEKNTPVVIVNKDSFADALSISAPASINGYPVLLSDTNNIPESIKDIILKLEPSKIFIAGGKGVLNENIEKEAKLLSQKSEIIRLGGINRYDTSLKINENFNNKEVVILVSGDNYCDALSGSALAAKLNASILLVDDASLNNQIKYIDKNKTDYILILGGEETISKNIIQNIIK